MNTKDQLLERLQKMLAWKKSRKYYAERLGITEAEVNDLMKDLEGDSVEERFEAAVPIKTSTDYSVIGETGMRFSENVEKETAEVSANLPEEIKSLEDLIEKCKIDTSKWEVQKYVQNYWGNSGTPHWQVKAWLVAKQKSSRFTDDFKRFLANYKSPQGKIVRIDPTLSGELPDGCLVINKQDAHFNKYDIGGRNDIVERFEVVESKIEKVVTKASRSTDLEKIVYVVGSDQFNSEWNGCTTRGTPQQNLTHFHDSFELICDHEVRVVNFLLRNTDNLHILYVSGNHDEYVGWHMIKWMQAYYRDEPRITIDTSHQYRKYVQYGSTALMFNHGDAMKPQALASLFPVEFREGWSDCENFYVFTGDKHREINADFNGIKFYGIPALSNAKGTWDHKQGYTGSRAELTAFVINYNDGMDAIYKELIR